MTNSPITRKEVDDLIETSILKFTTVLTKEFSEFAEKQKTEQRLSREHTFEQGTGYSWDNRGHFKGVITWAAGAKKNTTIWRNTAILAFIGLAIKTFWNDIV